MRVRGLVQAAELEEDPPESGQIEMLLRVQGVGPGQPRRLVVPFDLLIREPDLDPEAVARRAFEAEVDEVAKGRWVVSWISFAGRILRPPGS